jgi:hypothetical protein
MNRTNQKAQRHAEPNGDVAELGRAFDGIAEKLARGGKVLAMD